MHSSSFVSKYKERYGLNGLQATAAAPSCIPTKDRRSSTPRYSHSMMCKRVFRVKLSVSSIHLCIHHYYHLYPNTEKEDMAWMVSRLLQLLLVAYQLIVTGIPSNNIHRTDANVCSEWKGGRSPSLFIISSVILLLSSSSRSIQEDEDNTHHYYCYHHHSLCPKSTWTQEKCSQIHLNVLISSKFPYFASTPTFII